MKTGFTAPSALFVLVSGLAGLLVFYRCLFLSGFDLMPGDIGDTKFNMVILEHWFRVARGLDGWRSPNFYFPVTGVLGYSDGLMLLALPYVAGRLAGLAPFHAFQGMILLWSMLGYAGMVVWLRRGLELAWPATVAAALAFAFGTELYQALAIGHVQLLAVEALPWLALFALYWLRGIDANSRGSFAWGCATVALLAALLLTAFYVGWFVILQGLVLVALAAAVVAGRMGIRRALAGGGSWLAGHWRHAATVASALLLGLVPFLMVYGPILHDGVVRDYATVSRYLPTLADLHAPQGNWLWQPVAQALMPWLAERKDELGKGLSWGLVALFLATLARLMLGHRRGRDDHWLDAHPLALALGLSVVAGWLLMIKVDGVSLWYGVYSAVPGGIAVRTAHRFNCVLAFSVATVAAVGLDRLWQLQRGRPVALALAALIALEQVNVLPKWVSQRTDLARVAATPPPPAACRAFVLLPSRLDPAWHHWTRQLDAVLLAQAMDLPTLNGESGNAPPGWKLFDPADRPAYPEAVLAWADRYRLWDGLCALDIDAGRWSALDRTQLLPPATGR